MLKGGIILLVQHRTNTFNLGKINEKEERKMTKEIVFEMLVEYFNAEISNQLGVKNDKLIVKFPDGEVGEIEVVSL